MQQDWGALHPRWSGVVTDVVDVAGTQVRLLRHHGAPGAEDGLPHLFVHGLGGAATNWLENLADLSRFGPTAAVDLPGFGETEPPTRRAATIRNQVRFVRALCRKLGWDQVVLYGNSMGGMVATMVAAEDPILVQRLVLVAPAFPASPVDSLRDINTEKVRLGVFATPFPGRERLFKRYSRRATPAQLWEEMAGILFVDVERVNPALREVAMANYVRGQQLDWRPRSFLTAVQSLIPAIQSPGYVETIRSVLAPTMFLWGREDQLVSASAQAKARDLRPDWDFVTYDECGHTPQLEYPDEFARDVGEWLESTGLQPAADRAEADVP